VKGDRSTVGWSSRVEDRLSSVVVSDGGEATAALRARRRAGTHKQSAAYCLIWQHLPDSHGAQQGERKIQVVELQAARVNRVQPPHQGRRIAA